MTSVSRSNISSLNPHRHTLLHRLTHAVQGRSLWERRIAHYECTTSTLACLALIQAVALFMIWHIMIIHRTFIHAHNITQLPLLTSFTSTCQCRVCLNISSRLHSRRGLQMVADKWIVLEISKIIILEDSPDSSRVWRSYWTNELCEITEDC